jgi:hypothetical protein
MGDRRTERWISKEDSTKEGTGIVGVKTTSDLASTFCIFRSFFVTQRIPFVPIQKI